MKIIYSTSATSIGARQGRVISDNEVLDLEFRSPKAMGGINDDYAKPEMLFAAGYAACFNSVLQSISNKDTIDVDQITVKVTIGIGQQAQGGYTLQAELHGNIPGADLDHAISLMQKAHEICPYSNITRGNMEVKLTVSVK